MKFGCTLFQIIRQHNKQKRIYQQIITIFPSLKFPPLNSCKDYQQSLQVKYHLSYLLGEALIRANKNWIKGGYFKLTREIKRASESFKIHQKYKTKLQTLDLPYQHIAMTENISYAISSLNALEITIKNWKSQTRNFALEHWQEIIEWLASQEFQEQYLDTNHPYPPLLNPKEGAVFCSCRQHFTQQTRRSENIL